MKGARNLKELDRELMKEIFRGSAADDFDGPIYKDIGKKLIEVVFGKKEASKYTSDIGKQMKDLYVKGLGMENSANMVNGSAVADGYIGYCNPDGVISLADYRDKPNVHEFFKKGLNAAVGDHEEIHKKYPGMRELDVETENIESTRNPILKMFKDALLNIGIGQGRKEAKDAADRTGFLDRMKNYYKSELKPVFEDINYNVAELLGMKPEYAYSTAEVD